MSKYNGSRVVLDTNILVAAAYASSSASRRIVQHIADGDLSLVVSEAVLREYRFILERAVRRADFLPVINKVVGEAEMCREPRLGRWVVEDPDDDKFIGVALAARVDALVTNDHHVLKMGQIDDVRILQPSQFLIDEEASG